MLLSLVIINALGVTSMTNERDGRSLDLLLVTDLSPREFLFGKLGGVLYVTLDAVLLPILLLSRLVSSAEIELPRSMALKLVQLLIMRVS